MPDESPLRGMLNEEHRLRLRNMSAEGRPGAVRRMV